VTAEEVFSVLLLQTLNYQILCLPTVHGVGEVDFWMFWIFKFLQFAIDGKNNSKTKVEKRKDVLLYFDVFLCGNEFF
jgi:hypothetical protein